MSAPAPPGVPSAEPARGWRTPGVVAARLVGGGTLALATLLVLRPFVVPLLWAAILAYVTWPLYQRLAGTRRRELRAAAGPLVAFGSAGRSRSCS
jgi:predicted PurR-regulated permease PerM